MVFDKKREEVAHNEIIDGLLSAIIPQKKITEAIRNSYRNEVLEPLLKKINGPDSPILTNTVLANISLGAYKQIRTIIADVYKTTDPEINKALEVFDEKIMNPEYEISAPYFCRWDGLGVKTKKEI